MHSRIRALYLAETIAKTCDTNAAIPAMESCCRRWHRWRCGMDQRVAGNASLHCAERVDPSVECSGALRGTDRSMVRNARVDPPNASLGCAAWIGPVRGHDAWGPRGNARTWGCHGCVRWRAARHRGGHAVQDRDCPVSSAALKTGTLCCIFRRAVSIPETGGASNALRAEWHT